MLDEIFEFYYTRDMHPVRLIPLTKEELHRGMSEEAVEKYLLLVKQLYDAFSFDVNAVYVRPSDEELQKRSSERARIYEALIKHLFKNDAISDDAYFELHKYMPIEFGYIERPDKPGKYVSDTLDDFRLSFERCVVDSDIHTDLRDYYLNERYGYGVCVRPETGPKPFVTSSDLFIYRDEEQMQLPYTEISYWEARQLLHRIRRDMEKNTEEQASLDKNFCRPISSYSYISSLQKNAYKAPKNITEWYTIKRALETEASLLWSVEDQINRIFETMEKPTNTVGTGSSLYIYKGRTICHQQKHVIVSATAILYDEYDQEVELDVEYCPACQRYMMNHVSFEQYREKYHVLIGKIRMLTSNGSFGEFDMALESPLKLCGYTVSQTEGLSSAARQFILAKIIHDRIMSKIEVIHYLEHFIKMNGSKKENALAVMKWQDDLEFVHKYDITIQPRVFISNIKRY